MVDTILKSRSATFLIKGKKIDEEVLISVINDCLDLVGSLATIECEHTNVGTEITAIRHFRYYEAKE